MHTSGQRTKLTLVLGLARGVRPFHPGQSLRYSLEQRLDVVSQLSRRLHEHEVVLLGLVLALLRGNLALVIQVGLVADKDNDDIVSSLGSDVVDPFSRVLE